MHNLQGYNLSAVEEAAKLYLTDGSTEYNETVIKIAPDENSFDIQREEEHYWGQTLQFLTQGKMVERSDPITLVTERDGSKLHTYLEGLANDVYNLEQAPWVGELSLTQCKSTLNFDEDAKYVQKINSLLRYVFRIAFCNKFAKLPLSLFRFVNAFAVTF